MKTEWISVEERLPETGVDMLVCDQNGAMTALPFDTLTKKWDESIISYWDNSDEITHWTTLPEHQQI